MKAERIMMIVTGTILASCAGFILSNHLLPASCPTWPVVLSCIAGSIVIFWGLLDWIFSIPRVNR